MANRGSLLEDNGSHSVKPNTQKSFHAQIKKHNCTFSFDKNLEKLLYLSPYAS
jgi:hypothetical protein